MELIRRTFIHVDKSTFKALFRPHLQYANTVWCPTKMNNIITTENVLKDMKID